MKYIFLSVVFLLHAFVYAQRMVLPLNKGWKFSKIQSGTEHPLKVDLPHTWNVADVMDDEPGYYRGSASYKKTIPFNRVFVGKEIYLFFEGANQTAKIYVNDQLAGVHIGGYTAFNIRLTSFFNFKRQNEIRVEVSNGADRNVPPLSADFTFYGGLYRKVSLVALDDVHMSCDDHGSNAVFISTSTANEQESVVDIRTIVSNRKKTDKKIKLTTTIYDAAGRQVTSFSCAGLSKISGDTSFLQAITIDHPVLWTPEHPYLYKVVSTITDIITGKKVDEVTNPLGIRWFRFDADSGFFLNGKPIKLIGASRHQDREGMGNAVPEKLARKDVELLKQMGANFLRVAHYPQDPVVMKACDELGLLSSVEIPVVNEINESDSFYNNCLAMQTEMIRQNYNHPSVIIWCYMNEILLRPQFNNDNERQNIYFSNIRLLAKKLDSLTRKEDPLRYTMMANHGAYGKYADAGLIDIPMITGWNLYPGWYSANLDDLPAFLDRFHKDHPAKPVMITEYGADADPRIRSAAPVRFDKSVEYATVFHQYYFKQIMARSFVSAGVIWNLADFNSETRNETMPHINNKGLLQWNRVPKDPYYFYKAMLSSSPFVKVLGSKWSAGIADSGKTTGLQKVQVAANRSPVSLSVNGRSFPDAFPIDGICEWMVPFVNGTNVIEASVVKHGRFYVDSNLVDFRLQPFKFQDKKIFSDLNILAGSKRLFIDSAGNVWQPDQQYYSGGWGHVNGKPFKLTGSSLPYGTDKNIKGTPDDPVYQTQLVGLSAYKMDVPDGEYEVTLYFAELMGGKVQEVIYNLNGNNRMEKVENRCFDVMINEVPVLQRFNIAKEFGTATAVKKTFKIIVSNKHGITVGFKATEGETILNALRVKKISR